MELKKIRIENYKSIDKLEFDIKKHSNSHTITFVGINEVGKSNILEAMSFLETPKGNFDFLELANQNNDSAKYIDIYFEMIPDKKELYMDIIRQRINVKEGITQKIFREKFIKEIDIIKIEKNVYLKRGEENFQEEYSLDIKNLKLDYLKFKKTSETVTVGRNNKKINKYEIMEWNEIPEIEKEKFNELNLENFKEILVDVLKEYFKKYENRVSFWKPDEKYLITSVVDMTSFKENLNENIPLRNIFYLAGYKNKDEIKTKIEEIEKNDTQLRRLEKQLSQKSTAYLNSVWADHKVKIDFRITEQLKCKVKIQDKGKNNEDNFFGMQNRSDGFKQFASLIFTLSIENNKGELKNRLILVDEPENHLHPSGVRDMRNELINIGKNNYVFLATHSNFMIDNKKMERNIIINKDSNNNTFKKEIKDYNDIVDDEILRDAFGINVFKDFLTPNKLLVEGASDKELFGKAIKKYNPHYSFAITNGKGDNLPSIASLLNFEKISTLVIVDADSNGEKNKKFIKKIGGIFSDNNVYTIRDLEGNIQENGTLEDILPRDYVISKFKEVYSTEFNNSVEPILNESKPIISEIKMFLQQNLEQDQQNKVDGFLEKLKTKISNDYSPDQMEIKASLLYSLVKKIIEKLEND
ncbi:MAG: AAA family ATPase [Candidatus Aenigmarchaeota archaeon]|nr:AAA family ATPase [Candidatus Aenigmarchaeota archaeon]